MSLPSDVFLGLYYSIRQFKNVNILFITEIFKNSPLKAWVKLPFQRVGSETTITSNTMFMQTQSPGGFKCLKEFICHLILQSGS